MLVADGRRGWIPGFGVQFVNLITGDIVNQSAWNLTMPPYSITTFRMDQAEPRAAIVACRETIDPAAVQIKGALDQVQQLLSAPMQAKAAELKKTINNAAPKR